MFAAPVSDIASPTLMSAFGACDADADGSALGAAVPPHAATSIATVIDATANSRALIAEPPRERDRPMLATVEPFAHGGLAHVGRAASHHVPRGSHGEHDDDRQRSAHH